MHEHHHQYELSNPLAQLGVVLPPPTFPDQCFLLQISQLPGHHHPFLPVLNPPNKVVFVPFVGLRLPYHIC
eukprot:Gb_40795 [translate_table: standard]